MCVDEDLIKPLLDRFRDDVTDRYAKTRVRKLSAQSELVEAIKLRVKVHFGVAEGLVDDEPDGAVKNATARRPSRPPARLVGDDPVGRI